MIENKFVNSSLGKRESYCVSARDIELGERELMEGLNYQMRCHHPHAAIRVLAKEMSRFLSGYSSDSEERESRDPCEDAIVESETDASPRQVSHFVSEETRERRLYEKSIQVAENALLCSDVSFLFSPGPIAFAAVAVAARNGRKPERNSKGGVSLEPEMKEFLRVRFPVEEDYDLSGFESQVLMVVERIDKSPTNDSNLIFSCQTNEPHDGSIETLSHIREIQRVSSKVASLRAAREDERHGSSRGERYQSPRKRKDADEPLAGRIDIAQSKIPRVTPTRRLSYSD